MKLQSINLNFFSKKQFCVTKISALFVLLLLIVSSCEKRDDNNQTAFKSNFNSNTTNVNLGSEYWSDKVQDWQIANNNMECLVSNKYSKIHLLSRELGTKDGNVEMKSRVGFFNTQISSLNKNWAGFNMGAKREFSNYNESTNYKKGIDIGICTNGALFIGAPSPNHKNKTIIEALKTGVDLKVLLLESNDGYTIEFSVLEIESGNVLGHISKKNIAREQFVGDFVLVSNFEDHSSLKDSKSVWFQNWEIKGSKLIKNNKRFSSNTAMVK